MHMYVCTVTRDFSSEEESTILRMMQAVAVPIVGNVCHVFMNGLNRVQVYDNRIICFSHICLNELLIEEYT